MARKRSRVIDVEVTARAKRQDAELAMGSDPMNAIVELVTNADDAYLAKKSHCREKIRIEVERHRGKPTKIVVKDRAGGMTVEELESRLGRMGGRTSGFETGAERRGLFGRGAKDIVHFGRARWESVKGKNRSYLELLYEGRFTGQAEIGRMQGPHGRPGTEATLWVQSRFQIPLHRKLLEKLRNHYALRPILLDVRQREVLLADLSQQREEKVRFARPKAQQIVKDAVAVPGYPNQQIALELYLADEPLSEEGEDREYWRHSILVTSGRAAYEIFDGGKFSREPYASHLRRIYGYASVDGINQLIREFDDAEEQGRPPDEQNPIRIVRRDRRGLVSRSDHPFVEALYRALEEALEPHLERLKKAAEEAKGDISHEARRRWDRAGKELAKLMNEGGSQEGLAGKHPPLGLSLIPTVRIVEPGEVAHVLVRYRSHEKNALFDANVLVDVMEVDEEGENDAQALLLEARTGYFSKTYAVAGRPEGSMSEVIVRFLGEEMKALIEWRHRPLDRIEQFEFERAKFSIKDGQKRQVRLFAPWDTVASVGEQVSFKIEGDSTITLPRSQGMFTYDEARDAGVCQLSVRGQGVGSRARLTATLAGEEAETELTVTSSGVAGIEIDVNEFKIDQRAWLEGGTLKVNARDPTIRRYLGPKNAGWPGQNSVPFNVMLAEVIVEAASRSQLQREAGSGDPLTLFGRQMALMRRWLPAIHRALVPDVEVRPHREN
ncbi:MAG: hypothetical protein F4228_02835 [Acidobacteria bacterium]|nr:hypothetical protein [Acidobacteriota bacterium]MYF13620.1 hypothetical protein [Acidobacteriota bacterium]MYI95376.1 hypothetical protein [Acidobacteriota bacterium]